MAAANSTDSKKAPRARRGGGSSIAGNKNVVNIFNAMCTQDGELELRIVVPKYEKIRRHVDRFVKILEALRDWRPLEAAPADRAALAAYAASLRAQIAQHFSAPVLAEGKTAAATAPAAGAATTGAAAAAALEEAFHFDPYGHVPADVRMSFCAVYRKIAGCPLVESILVTCKNCTQYRTFLRDAANLNPKFLLGAGSIWAPLHGLPVFNFKRLYTSVATPADRNFVLTVIHKLYTVSHDVYDALSEPDLDVTMVTQMIRESIGEVRKAIPRCTEAFDCIASSTDLLEKNFGSYYKDFAGSGNPAIIMEHYVRDVAKSTDGSTKVVSQFNKIMSHYRKTTANMSANDPVMNTLFSQVDSTFSELEDLEKQQDAAESAATDAPTAATATDATATSSTAAADATGAAAAAAPLSKSAKKRIRHKNQAALAKLNDADATGAAPEDAVALAAAKVKLADVTGSTLA